jgi:tetratricopeptide (TPR) repeat protein
MVEIEASPGKKAFQQRDFQRLSRTRFRWAQATHNQLVCNGIPEPQPVDVTIVSDTSLRTMDQQGERNAQREDGMTGLIDEIANGNLNALFHLAKHRASSGDLAQAVQLAEDFRSRVYPNSVLMEQRQWVSLAVAFRYYNEDQLAEANRWSCRTLLDGPSLPAFCLLGDIAEDEGDLPRALRWYQAACAITEDAQIGWPWMTNMRWGRLAGIKLALGDESLLLLAPRQDHDQHQATDPDAGQQKV